MAMDMHHQIDIYCERLDPSFWAEPINAITNLAFLLSAFAALCVAKRYGSFRWDTLALIVLVATIGIGSFLFHTVATYWAMLADVIPITLYQIFFLGVYARYIVGLSRIRVIMLLLGFVTLSVTFDALPREWLNGSLGYGPALLFVLGFGIWHYRHARAYRYDLLLAGVVFVVSLTFRSLDMAVCHQVPFGIHFFWHVFNGVVLFLTTRGYITNHPLRKTPSA